MSNSTLFLRSHTEGKRQPFRFKREGLSCKPSASFRVGFFLFHARATRPIFAALLLPSIFLRLIRFAQDAIVLLKLVIRRGKGDLFLGRVESGNAPGKTWGNCGNPLRTRVFCVWKEFDSALPFFRPPYFPSPLDFLPKKERGRGI